MTSRPVRSAFMMVLAVAIASPAAAAPAQDPFPVGACVRVSLIDPQPICLIVDPTP